MQGNGSLDQLGTLIMRMARFNFHPISNISCIHKNSGLIVITFFRYSLFSEP